MAQVVWACYFTQGFAFKSRAQIDRLARTIPHPLQSALTSMVTPKLVLNTVVEHCFARIPMAIFLHATIDRFTIDLARPQLTAVLAGRKILASLWSVKRTIGEVGPVADVDNVYERSAFGI